MYTYNLVDTKPSNIIEYSKFLSNVFDFTEKFTKEFLEWEYLENPNGSAVGFNAYYGDMLVAHYVTQPITAYVNGNKVKGLLSINTATHPEHRKKDLFINLVKLTCEYATNEGFEFIYGVANANSTHGFINKLDFQLVSPLITKIGVGEIIYKSDNVDYDFYRVWTKKELKWRFNNPSKEYFVKNNKIIVPTGKFGLNALMYILEANILEFNNLLSSFDGLKLFNLYVGLDSSIDWSKSFYFDVPLRLKSSPLNLIFKDLTNKGLQLDPNKVKLQIIDFDGY